MVSAPPHTSFRRYVCGRAGKSTLSHGRKTPRRSILPKASAQSWTGGSDDTPPVSLDAAIIFAPVGELVPVALRALRKGGRLVCGGIHMSDVPAMPYSILWGERELVSVANLTRKDAETFFPVARLAGVKTYTVVYPLLRANEALDDLRSGKLSGAAVLVP